VNFGFFFLRPAALKMLAVAKATSALFALQATKIKAPNFHLLCPRGAYDGNGNLKSDSYKGISTITYNHLNLPKLITFSSGNTIEIIYDASGNKLRKIVKQGATVQYEQDYSGGIEYRKTPAAGTFRIEAIYHEEGRYFNLNVDASNTPSWRKEYALRDHLGSTRLLFADKDGDGMVEVTSNPATNEVLQENHYYPFGLSYGGSHWMNDAARDHKYLYNGKEIQDDWSLNLYAYGARYYDAALARFTGVDPIADQFPHVSEFNYAENEPVANIDLWGLQKYKPNIQRVNKPGDVFSGKTIQNMKEGIKTAVVEYVSVIKDGVNKLGNGLGNLIAGTMPEGKPEASDYQDAGGSIKGTGISILSSNEKNANGVLDTKEADGGVTSIIESGEILLPADGGGIIGDAASKSTQFSKSANFGGLSAYKFADLKNSKTGENKPVDSTCLHCPDKPHGLEYIRFDIKGNPIDTIDPKNKKQ